MPTTCPASLTRGPPESPGLIAVSAWINPPSVSSAPVRVSVAETVWLSATTRPGTALGVPPWPPALPSATTGSPTATPPPIAALGRPPAPRSCSTATSCGAVVADHVDGVGLAVADVERADVGGARDHVVVGQHDAARIDDDAGSGPDRVVVAELGADVDDLRPDLTRSSPRASRRQHGQRTETGGRRGSRRHRARPSPTTASTLTNHDHQTGRWCHLLIPCLLRPGENQHTVPASASGRHNRCSPYITSLVQASAKRLVNTDSQPLSWPGGRIRPEGQLRTVPGGATGHHHARR